jgi:gliding motility-associated-like protein
MAIIKVTDANGCSNSDSQYVFISGPLKFFTPNVFTPNGDGHNEGFGPVGIQFARNYVFTIYSRWGEIIFRSENLNEQWDGRYQEKLCPNGVYIYTIQLMDIYSKNKYFKGSVLLKW